MNKSYGIYDCIQKRYISQIITISPETPFMEIKFGDEEEAVEFKYKCLAKDTIREIYKSFSRDDPWKKMNLSVRRLT